MRFRRIQDIKLKRHYEDIKENIEFWYILLACSTYKLSESIQSNIKI